MLELARGLPDAISLGRGDPDLPTPRHISEASYRAMLDGQTHYTPTPGIVPLRQAIAEKMLRENHVAFSAEDEILVTTGGQEAICIISLALFNPGDEVIIPNPSYVTYNQAALLAGGTAVQVPLRSEAGFQLDPADVEAAITPRTKAVVVVSPNNPTGTVFPLETLRAVAEIATRHNILVVHDEIYEKILFDGARHHGIADLPGMRERTIVVNGFSKLYSMTGWRVGWIAAAAPLMKGMAAVKYTLDICTPAPSQWAALAAITGPQDCVAETVATYTRRRQWLIQGLREVGLDVAPHHGGIFLFADIRKSGIDVRGVLHGAAEGEAGGDLSRQRFRRRGRGFRAHHAAGARPAFPGGRRPHPGFRARAPPVVAGRAR